MSIVPDDKNWTWVLETLCPDCGFDGPAFDVTTVGASIRANADQWVAVLGRPDSARRPDDSTWSPLEYGCHVRDVYELFNARLGLMLDQDDPQFANWDQDVTAVEQRYDLQQPDIVGAQIVTAAGVIADRFDDVSGAQWHRTGRRSDGATFTVDSFARYLLHDPVHHLWDVGVS